MRAQFLRNTLCVIVSILGFNASVTLATAVAIDPAPLINEHPGQVFKTLQSSSTCGDGVLNGVNSTGTFKNISGSMFKLL